MNLTLVIFEEYPDDGPRTRITTAVGTEVAVVLSVARLIARRCYALTQPSVAHLDDPIRRVENLGIVARHDA